MHCRSKSGFVHRLVDHGKNEYSDHKGGHINGLKDSVVTLNDSLHQRVAKDVKGFYYSLLNMYGSITIGNITQILDLTIA